MTVKVRKKRKSKWQVDEVCENPFEIIKHSQVEDDDPTPMSIAPAIPPPKLKITLKLPANNTSTNSAGTATPDDAEMDYAAFKRTPKRRAKGVIHLVAAT